MKARMKKSNLSFLLVLLVLTVFMVSTLLVLLTGADVVQSITERDEQNYEKRTVLQYIATRVRQADEAGMVAVQTSAEGDKLVLTKEIDGLLFDTTVYCHNGYLCEHFCASGYAPGAEFGEKILPAESFCVKDHGEYLELEITFADGQTRSLILQLRSKRSGT